MLLASAVLGPIASNIPLDGAPRLAADLRTLRDEPGVEPGIEPRHAMVDFGDDELTRGRPHPMIDGSLRAQWLVRQGESAAEGDGVVVLLDVVLGHGAHPDPAAELVPAIERARAAAAGAGAAGAGGGLAVVVSLCGTAGDPQGLHRQGSALQAAGASVHLSNADAVRTALALLTPGPTGPAEEIA
jgi:FdrA protein